MLKRFLKEEKGQSTVEYILVIGVVVLLISAFGSRAKGLLEGITDQLFGNIKNKINELSGSK